MRALVLSVVFAVMALNVAALDAVNSRNVVVDGGLRFRSKFKRMPRGPPARLCC
jgi:hypothetical protein